MLACDFLTVEKVLLTRVYVLFFVSVERRRVEFIASTTNLVMQLDDGERRFRFLLHDRDSKLCCDFDSVFRSEGIRIIRTPVRAPNANAHAERWVGTLRRECLDRILILNRRHLDRVLRAYVAHQPLPPDHRAHARPPRPPARLRPRLRRDRSPPHQIDLVDAHPQPTLCSGRRPDRTDGPFSDCATGASSNRT
jgi:putative transposase